jgi:hypothetical protein
MSSTVSTANVSGSVVFTSQISDEMNRVKAVAPAIPTAASPAITITAWRKISVNTSQPPAPSAIRIPISRVRCSPAYAITP